MKYKLKLIVPGTQQQIPTTISVNSFVVKISFHSSHLPLDAPPPAAFIEVESQQYRRNRAENTKPHSIIIIHGSRDRLLKCVEDSY
jgi:hypothetical protein